jgi:hypothetical protein
VYYSHQLTRLSNLQELLEAFRAVAVITKEAFRLTGDDTDMCVR